MEATPKVELKVALVAEIEPVLAQLIPLLDDPASATTKQAVTDYAKALRESLPKLREQAEYMKTIKSGQAHLAYLSPLGIKAIADAVALADGVINNGKAGLSADAHKVMQETGMTDAEVAAIKIYTSPDYRYMNAGLEKNRAGWLQDAIAKVPGGRSADNSILGAELQPGEFGPLSPADTAAEEGVRHGKMAVEGLRKMKPWVGKTYRGMGLPPAEFKAKFEDVTEWSANAFTSTSIDQSVSRNFAKAEGKVPGKVGFLLIYTVTDGRDIADLSIYRNEGEVLLLPGAKAKIDKVQTGPGGVKEVHLTQTN
jgi:ADP-ribosyltransferase exoenzyme